MFGRVNVAFESSTGEWGDVMVPSKGRTYDAVLRGFARFQVVCQRPDALLVRTTPFPVMRLPAWPRYVLPPERRLPYEPPRIRDHSGFIHCRSDTALVQPRQ